MSAARVVLGPAALRDANAVAEHLSEEAGHKIERRFARELERTFDLLVADPEMGRRTARSGTYLLLMAHFLYHLIYKLIGREELRILRISHAHRRPLTWL